MKDPFENRTKPYYKTHSLHPENQETPIHFIRSWITPTEYFYRRNHFPYPDLTSNSFLLQINGEIKDEMVFPYRYIKSLPAKEVTMVLECSGNKRSRFEPEVYGEQWEDGAVSQGIWKGVPLHKLLEAAGLKSTAVEVVFEGLDYGERTDFNGVFRYARSLPVEKAMHPDTIIAYQLNNKPIPYRHGFPLRLVVPQWYAMASVKWLNRITVIDHEFKGPFQTVDYVYYPNKDDDSGKKPVTTINVDSIIQKPTEYSILDKGLHEIYGIAWAGKGVIEEVELSFDKGLTWVNAELYRDKREPYSWVFWKYRWDIKQSGEYTIMSRARDSAGSMQPSKAEWNRKGYGYNAVYTAEVKVE
ncbi:MAG TPA: sulfite oxidase [Clostridia bacterium]|nr:sulfite oxidase [Clostridia bacterium]